MKYLRFTLGISIIGCLILSLNSCKDDEPPVTPTGQMELVFSHFIGNIGLNIFEEDDDFFQYITRDGERFNVTKFGYHISDISFSGPNGEFYQEELVVNANEAKGVYRIDHSIPDSRLITIENMPEGSYNSISFTVGVDADKITEGEQGGILDPNNGAWYRNWEAGYMMLRFEGRSPSSPQIATSKYPEQGMHIHITGWKDITDNPMMVNNVKRFTYKLPQELKVGEDWLPNIHFGIDILQMLESPEMPIDFSQTYDVHHPIDAKPFADRLPEAFYFDHVHQ